MWLRHAAVDGTVGPLSPFYRGMRLLLIAALALGAACDSSTPSGTLGLPTARPSASATTPAPTTPRPTASRSGSPSVSAASASASASTSAAASASPSATAATTAGPRPGIVAASATQVSLTVAFSRPMRSKNSCGTSGTPTGPSGTIDALSVGPSASFGSPDRTFDETLRSAIQAFISGDCTTVTFVYERLAAAGTFTVNVNTVQDLTGSTIDPARASVSVTIRDEGRPQVVGVESSSDVITVTFSEPMMEIGEGGGVAMLTNYRLDGNTPRATSLSCNDFGCRSVRMTLQSGSLVPAHTYELRVANVVDRTGLNITPDPTTLIFIAR